MNHSQIVSFLWGVADLIRDTFKRDRQPAAEPHLPRRSQWRRQSTAQPKAARATWRAVTGATTMKADHPKNIGKIFRDGTLTDKALKDAALEAKRAHQRLGLPAAAWRDAHVVWVPAEELEAEPEDDAQSIMDS